MKTYKVRVAASILAFGLMFAAGAAQAQGYGGPPPPQARWDGERGWEAPPPEFAAARQRGFRDGIDGAKKDFENHRRPDVRNRDEFRNPHFIPGPDRREYKMGFRRGYEVAVRHMFGGPR